MVRDHQQMEQDVSEPVSRIRGEGVDRIIKLKRKYGCTKGNAGLTQSKVQQSRKELQVYNVPKLVRFFWTEISFFFQIKRMKLV